MNKNGEIDGAELGQEHEEGRRAPALSSNRDTSEKAEYTNNPTPTLRSIRKQPSRLMIAPIIEHMESAKGRSRSLRDHPHRAAALVVDPDSQQEAREGSLIGEGRSGGNKTFVGARCSSSSN
jgi:hypothetical protein